MRPSSKINQDLFLHNYTKELEKAMFLSITQSGNVDNVIGHDFQSVLSKYPKNLVVSPHLFKKVAVPGICED